MGISKLIGLKATVLLLIVLYLKKLGLTLLSIPFIHAFLVASLVSIASHPSINLPLLLGKRSDGSFPIWSIILFGPFLYFVRAFGLLRRMISKEPSFSEIYEGIYVGGWPSSLDQFPNGGDIAIIDCTSELPRRSFTSKNSYLCVPTWDTRSPQPAEIESAVRWACRQRNQRKSVLIHCAFGHGRSVAVTCALLVELGIAEDWKNAEQMIREKRPCIRMNSLHRKNLEEWSQNRLSSSKRNKDGGVGVSSILLSSGRSQLRKPN